MTDPARTPPTLAGPPAPTASSTTASAGDAPVGLVELARESRMGALGTETDAREIRIVDLSDFDRRRGEITEQLWDAAVDVGFFQLSGHGVPLAQIDEAFAMSARFFSLADEVKMRFPLADNAGWERRAQVRPSTGTPDQKESYQITRPRMAGRFPSDDELAGFRSTMLDFEAASWTVGMRVLSCFADRLGFDRDFFTRAHDPTAHTYQSTLRLLHYHAVDAVDVDTPGPSASAARLWRAGAHTDFGCLTLLYQRAGQGGLQVCPGKDAPSQQWTSIAPRDDLITCNIGDMLMRWSDDRLPSTFHRVRNPRPGEDTGPRASIAFFCQANTDVVIDPPGGTHPPITAGAFLAERVRANFASHT